MENDPRHTSVMPRDFTFQLLERITNNFSKDRIIGSGGYGVVYKGVLDNGEEIAVKKLYNKHPGPDEDKQFTNECTNLMRLQHQNIVRLVGYCYEITHKIVEYNGQYFCAGEEERALCFEYMQGGSLDRHLSDESCGLDWHTRYKIIKGICEGLHYLHNGSRYFIYHLDLKPANILLDKNMVPKIGDFGLSRLFDTTQTCITEGAIGTLGYMPPEYIDKYQITPKFDVFSLGVIIIQVMTGREGYYKCGNMPLQEFIDLVHGNWREKLRITMSSKTSHEIKTCIEIALRCVEPDRVKRPTIAEIVDELNKIDKNAMENNLQHTILMPKDFTFHFLEQITNNFSKDHIIGCGGYGAVYKGVLDNGEEIAVKKFYNKHPGPDDGKQFTNECTDLMRLQHQNIVRLVGYCYEIAHKVVEYKGQYLCAGVEERALCFEYLEGGSLDNHLYDESCGLGWHTRYRIIKGICEGLHYLHNGSKDPIYHLDLKPANILLDKNMVPKIGDFGLSRQFDSTQTCSTKGVVGTLGYMPPEYITRYQITPKFDVFSLGVIIIQVMTGREGYLKCGNMPRQEFIDLVHGNWMKRSQVTMSSRTPFEIKTCIEIALRCVEFDQVKRPTIAEIVDELNEIGTKRSLTHQDNDNLQSTQANQYTSSGAVDVALTVDHRDDSTSIRTKEQEHRTLEQKVLWGDPFDTQYPGPQTGGVLERFRSGGREGRDGLLWWHDLARCQDGNFSISVVQANYVVEDQCLVESSLPLGTVAGVFDGHGGPEAARFIRDNLIPNLREATSGPQGMTGDAIMDAFLATDQGFIKLVSQQWQTKPDLATVGSCCLVGVVHQRTLFIANLGDSRAVLGKVCCTTGELLAVQLSKEHNPNLEEARKELIAEHPDDPDIVVLKHNTWRVKGIIQVTRSIGDAYLKDPQYKGEPLKPKFRLHTPFSKPILTARPSISSHNLEPSDRFVIFASDGLWEHLSNQEAVDIVQKHQHAEGSARRLIEAALHHVAGEREMPYSDLKRIDRRVRRHFHDDITVIVLFFNTAVPPLSIRCPLDDES